MPTTYKGATVPLSSDLADGPAAFRDYTDSLPVSDAIKTGMVPVGTVVHNVRTVAPTGWLLMDGATVTGADVLYPELWAIIPATWKSGTSLVLPNSKGRIIIGIDSAQAGIDTPGELAGSATATIAGGNLPPHTHTQQGSFNTGGQSVQHVHVTAGSFVNTQPGGGIYAGGIGGSPASFTANNNVDHTHGVTIGGETGNGPGASTPLSILPPVLALNAFIRAA